MIAQLLTAIFGNGVPGAFWDKSELIYSEDYPGEAQGACEAALDTLAKREKRVVQLRFGLEDGRSRTLEEVGQVFAVSTERIRQIEAKALRKLRHPKRALALRKHAYVLTDDDRYAVESRIEIAEKLRSAGIAPLLAYSIAMRLKRHYLPSALTVMASIDTLKTIRELNHLAYMSCDFKAEIGLCGLCDEPTLPNGAWCLLHVGAGMKIPLVCDGCGVRFLRGAGQMVAFSKYHGKTQKKVFHDRACVKEHGVRLGIYERAKRTQN